MFIIMVVLWCRVMPGKYPVKRLKSIFLWIGVTWLVYGIGMELVQHYFINNRSFDLGDIAADAAGCLLGVVYSTSRYIKK